MYIEPYPFPHLKVGQYADLGNGEIIFFDESIDEKRREILREQYREWWNKKEKRREETGFE